MTAATRFASGREPLTERAARALRERILRGEIPGGTRLTEVRLASELGVSRTPLREALRRLATERFLETAPGKGYTVLPLSAAEVRELFALIAELELLALRWSRPVDTQLLGELSQRNAEFAEATDDVEEALARNAAWHHVLFRRCANSEVKRTIEELRTRIYRYEYHYFSSGLVHVKTAAGLHSRIMEALAAGDRDAVAAAVHAHWWTDLDAMLPEVMASGS